MWQHTKYKNNKNHKALRQTGTGWKQAGEVWPNEDKIKARGLNVLGEVRSVSATEANEEMQNRWEAWTEEHN